METRNRVQGETGGDAEVRSSFDATPTSIVKAAALTFLIGTVSDRASEAQTSSSPSRAFQVLEATIDDVHAALRAKRTTCRAIVEQYLQRIETYDKSGPRLNAVQTINPRVRQEADRLDASLQSSREVGALLCIPVLVKDQVETSDMSTTFGSAVFKDFLPQRDATIVTRLRNAGAVIVGKSTMGEYASGYLSSAAGPIRNAYDPKRHASGSSGGTGSGVSANFATIGIAEDTGGSTRGPAAVSNLVGLRPTVPLVSRHGMFPARPTTDTLGPVTRTVRDAAIVLDAIAGYDPKDPVTAYAVGHIPPSYTTFLTRDGLKGARIGVIRQPLDAKTDTASNDYRKVRTVIDKAVTDLRTLGAEIVDPITIPDAIERVNKPYEDNVFETEQAINKYLAEHPNAPVKTLREILMSGKVVPSRVRTLMNSVGKSTEDPGYLQVLRGVEDTRRVVLGLMADHRLDALVYATFDHQPVEIGPDDMTNPLVETSGIGNNRRLSPVLGFPAMTVPAGFTTDGLPVGIEFMARPFAEGALFKFGYAYEQATHHRKPPPLAPALRAEQ
jgi:Asp-tRNA(Asn)/Glu-tRNA(Gln) amidotransferase A subunit family amidase